MTIWELTRMFCYVISAPALFYLALWLARQHHYAQMCFTMSISLLFVWYMVEITIASTGVNTREYRVIGTPMVVTATIAAVWMVLNAIRIRRISRTKTKEHNAPVST